MPRINDRTNSTPTLMRCSFCGRDERRVGALIAGPGVYICDRCVDLSNEMIEQEK